MIEITQDEYMALKAKYGEDVHITITSKQKKHGRKKYYADESQKVMFFLDRYRRQQEPRCRR